MDNSYYLRLSEQGEKENETQWLRTCWVCDKEKAVTDMVFTYDRYICDTSECLLGAFEMVAEELEMSKGTLEACR